MDKKEYTPRTIGKHRLRPESIMMSHGYRSEWSEGALKSPIFQTSTFTFRTAEEGKAFFEVAYGLREQGPAEAAPLGGLHDRHPVDPAAGALLPRVVVPRRRPTRGVVGVGHDRDRAHETGP